MTIRNLCIILADTVVTTCMLQLPTEIVRMSIANEQNIRFFRNFRRTLIRVFGIIQKLLESGPCLIQEDYTMT